MRPEVTIVPRNLGTVEAKLWIGLLLRGERPGGETYYVQDEEVALDRAVFGARITFFNDTLSVGEGLDVSLVHDC